MKYLSTSSKKTSPQAIFALLAFLIFGTFGAFFVNQASATNVTLSPTAEGSSTTWSANTGTKVTAVATNDSDTSYINQGTGNNRKQSFVVANAGVPVTAVINSVTVNVIAKYATPGDSGAKMMLMSEGTSEGDSTEKTLTASYALYTYTLLTNPSTGSAWSQAEVNAWTTKFGIFNTVPNKTIRVTQLYVVVDYSAPSTITASISASNKTYDGTNTASVTCSLSGVAPADIANVSCVVGSSTFANANVGNAKVVTATGLTLSGSAAANYALSSVSATSSANITPVTVAPSVSAENKVYDGNTSATTSCSLSGVLPADSANVSCAASAANFDNKHVGITKPVNAIGISLSGSAAGNYELNSINFDTSADITARSITVTAAHDEKFYDETIDSSATPTITSGSLLGVDTANWIQSFDTANVGTGKVLTPSGTINDGNDGLNYNVTFVTTDTGVINQANAPVTITNIIQDYNGTPRSVSIVTTPENLNFNVTYTGIGDTVYGPSGLAPIDAGTYQVDAEIVLEENYTGSDSKTLTVNKVDAAITVNGFNGIYDGAAHGATGSAIGVNEEDLSEGLNLGLTFTNVPGGSAEWTFNGGTNYNNASGSASIVINKADATIMVTPYNVTFDGEVHVATGSASGVNDEALSGLDLFNTAHISVGIYNEDQWVFTDETGNYNDESGTITDIINAVVEEEQVGGGSGVNVIPRIHAVNEPLTISGDSEGLLDQSFVDGSTIQLNVPQGAISTPTTFSIISTPSEGFPPLAGTIIGNTFIISAVDANGNPVTSFAKDLNITIKGLIFTDITNISLYFFDPITNTYQLVSTSGIDASGMVIFTVNHLTKFALIDLAGKQPTIQANTAVQQVLGEQRFANGTLLRDTSDKRMYLVTNNKLKYIATLNELAKYRGRTTLSVAHSVILGFEKEVLGATVYADGTLIKTKNSPKIYIIVKGKKVHIPNLAELAKYKGKKMIIVSE